MKNNKGFTIVELLVSFVLSMIIVIIMFELIINLKELYQTSGLKTEMLNKQNLMVDKIYTDLTKKRVTMINSCGTECIAFSFNDGSNKTLSVDSNNGIVTYDNYTIKLNNGSYFSKITISDVGISMDNGNNRIFSINIPIYNQMFKNNNFGINVVYIYNNNEVINNYS